MVRARSSQIIVSVVTVLSERLRFPAVLIVWALTSIALSSCWRKELPRPLTNDAYVWQRSWNDSLLQSLTQSAYAIQTWRILAAEADAKGDLAVIHINRQILRQLGKPVVAVIRIDGRSGAMASGEKLVEEGVALAADWQEDGVPVRGIELDYDCAAARLASYGDFLHHFRKQIPRDLRLSITALPSWMGSRDLPNLLSQVDETVLQVHSVSNPREGLFDRRTAFRWAQAWSALSPVPFRVALPTYWSRVTWNAEGRVEAIESEAARYGSASAGHELLVQPGEVAAMVGELQRVRLRNLTGIAWFRLPTDLDRRAWSSRTWHAVMQGKPLQAALPVVHFKAEQTGAKDIYLLNQGDLDAKLPAMISITAQGCDFADAMPPYEMERKGKLVRFQLKSDDLLRAGEQRLIGWIRCSSENPGAHVSF